LVKAITLRRHKAARCCWWFHTLTLRQVFPPPPAFRYGHTSSEALSMPDATIRCYAFLRSWYANGMMLLRGHTLLPRMPLPY
jgi:hypothetical protein